MSNIDKRALREVAEKATQGPWEMEQENIWFTDEDGYTKHLAYVEQGDDVDDKQDHYNTAYIAAANPATMLALLDENIQLHREKDAIEGVALALRDDMRDAREKLEAAERRIAEQSAIVAAAEKLVRCKGRYHSELNYRALAKLFGVITPDLPPLEHENVHYADAAEVEITALRQRIAELEHSETQLINERDSAESALNDAYKAVMGQAPEWSNWFSFENAIDEIELVCELWRNQTDDVIQFRQRIAELESNEIREDGNQFLVVRHPGKTPVIKHWSGDPEEFLRNLIEQDPLVIIDIITHRYYGVGGQWVQDADEYLHMMAAAGTGKGK
ncbi:TPA: ead/Ea22-like family protein [Salmonella enterica]|nr:ead/Ea22-like family protein [Salmonella enterica]